MFLGVLTTGWYLKYIQLNGKQLGIREPGGYLWIVNVKCIMRSDLYVGTLCKG